MILLLIPVLLIYYYVYVLYQKHYQPEASIVAVIVFGLIGGLLLIPIVFAPVIFLLTPLVPVYAYSLYRMHLEEKDIVAAVILVVGVLFFGTITFLWGLLEGVDFACTRQGAGNLCGLTGFFVIAPLLSTLTVCVYSYLWLKIMR